MVLVASLVLASAYSFWSTLVPRRSWQPGGGWDGPSSCVSLRMLLEEFPVLCARAVRTWNLVQITWQSCHCFGRLGFAFEYENWILREVSVFVLGSTAEHALRQHFGRYGRIAHIFCVAADSNPEVLLSVLLQNVNRRPHTSPFSRVCAHV